MRTLSFKRPGGGAANSSLIRSDWAAGLGFPLVFVMVSFLLTPVGAADFSLHTLFGFGANPNDPKNPQGGLVQGSYGNFYGTTAFGGTGGDNGSVFSITPNGTVTNLLFFNSTNGSHPTGNLVLGTDGLFYGTTAFGGASNDNGTVFKITSNGVFTSLFSFNGANGSRPMAGLFQGSDSLFYGTTAFGGASNDNGTVFKITSNGVYTRLLSFNGTNGSRPMAGLVQGIDGSYYGTTASGGSTVTNGTVFKITSTGVFTLLSSFSGTNGSDPEGTLVQAPDGNFYGTTLTGGTTDSGTVFRITPGGALTRLYSFTGGLDGNSPAAGLTLGSDTNFYGTTEGTTTTNLGTVFRISTNGALTTLATFDGTNGASPVAKLVQGRIDGNFYGTGFDHGPAGGGTVFRLVPSPTVTKVAVTNGFAKVTWVSFTNGVFRAEFKAAMTDPAWTPLVPDIVATSNQTSLTNGFGSGTQRFYHIRLLP